MLRRHVFPVSERRIGSVWEADDITVPCLDPREIFAVKTVALLSRSVPRDLCDVRNMIRSGIFDGDEIEVRKCAVFYAAIASKSVPERFEIERIENMDPHRIWTDLVPMLRKGERFDLPEAQRETEEYLSRILVLDKGESEFWKDFGRRGYRPEKLFQSGEFLERIRNHPMALWKCRPDGRLRDGAGGATGFSDET